MTSQRKAERPPAGAAALTALLDIAARAIGAAPPISIGDHAKPDRTAPSL